MNGSIQLILEMDVDEKKEDQLNVEFWINPTSLKSYTFLKDFQLTLK
jgi:hypothetical protein